ncbi:hypothetical protein FSP39_023136 [Pinctada imbricata]|uniref:snRNA-activating protein complex subunit 4 n=1 Tax=Pinctada imbricata TaxID=66713 RepID=A0AA88XNM8_PINIB|nr:hypothetical protein FSP39_023136 [Pinctada imbricata]
MASEPSETEREEIEEDIERLQLALQADEDDKSECESDDEDALRIVENADNDGDISQQGFTQSEDGSMHVETNIIGIDELPVNADTSLALNRTYQELILDSLRKIEIALSENREKQNLLEEGLEQKTIAPKPKEKEEGTKKKSLVSYFKPYFKGSFGQYPPDNDDVKLKRVMKELEQNIQPPPAWSSAQRKTLQEAVKNDALKQLLTPLMNRKELLIEKSDALQSELGILGYQLRQRNEALEEEEDEEGGVSEYQEEEREAIEKLKIHIDQKNQTLKEIQDKIQAVDQEMESVKGKPTVSLLNSVDINTVDWLMIANSVMEGKRTVIECQKMWKNVLHPSINKGPWPKDEITKLQSLVEVHQMSNWPAIAEELGTRRTPFQCLQYYQQYLNETYSKREWTNEEDTMLQEVVENCQYGEWISWGQVSYFIDGRSPQQCQNRWIAINPNIKRGKWSLQEDCRLITAVRLHGVKAWSTVQDYIPGRTAVQCRDRYLSALDPNLKTPNLWSYEEDKKILTLVNKDMEEQGRVSWVKIARQLPGRSDNSVLVRYKRLMAWKAKCEWVDEQPESDRQAMGLLNVKTTGKNKTAAQKKKEVEQTSQAFKLAEINDGIKRDDYLKQLEDKKKGELVVPRPPLMCRYSTRSFKHVWDRKKQLFNMIHTHLAKEIPNVVTPDQRQALPNQTYEQFKDFTSLNERQQEVLKTLLKEKAPGEITVREILNMSRSIKDSRNHVAKIKKRFEEDGILDRKMQEVIMWKLFYDTCITFRRRCGRPRKFPILDRLAKMDEEKKEQITNITMSLLMNALDVDQKAALNNYKHKTDSKKREVPPEDLTFLEKLCTVRKEEKKEEPKGDKSNLGNESDITLGMPYVRLDDEALERRARIGNVDKSKESSVNDTQPTSTSEIPQTARPKNVRIIKLPPGQKLKPGTKISDLMNKDFASDIQVYNFTRSTVTSDTEGKEMASSTADNNEGPLNLPSTSAATDITTPQVLSTESGSRKNPDKLPTIGEGGSRDIEILPLEPNVSGSITASSPVIHIPDESSQNIITVQPLMTNVDSSLVPNSMSQSEPVSTSTVVCASSSSTITESVQNQDLALPSGSQSEIPTGTNVQMQPQSSQSTEKSTVSNVQMPSSSKVKVLPPCLTTMQAFEGILLHKRLLMIRAGNLYNKLLFKRRSSHLQMELNKRRLEKIKQEPQQSPALDLLKTMRKMDQTSNSIKSTERDTAGGRLKIDDDLVIRDPLAVARKTKAYQQLQQRFKALFMWPALLSTIAPAKTDESNMTRYISTHAKIGRKLKKIVQREAFEKAGKKRGKTGRRKRNDKRENSLMINVKESDQRNAEDTNNSEMKTCNTENSATNMNGSNTEMGDSNAENGQEVPPKEKPISHHKQIQNVLSRIKNQNTELIRLSGARKRSIDVVDGPDIPSDIFDDVSPGIESNGLDCECVGGGRIEHDPSKKKLQIYGYSQGFGRADHAITAAILSRKFKYENVTFSNDGY